MAERQLYSWTCPVCGEKNVDLQDDYTCCGACGRAAYVLAGDEDFNDMQYFVDLSLMDDPERAATLRDTIYK